MSNSISTTKIQQVPLTIKVLIERPIAGYPRNRQIWVNGEAVELNHRLSRRLTNTVDESGDGIFRSGSVFYRGDLSVDLEFGSWLSLSTQPDAESFLVELQRRVNMVYAAFDAKYTVMHSEKEVDMFVESSMNAPVTASAIDCN